MGFRFTLILGLTFLVMFLSPCSPAYAQEHWGSFQANQCTQIGVRQYSAILWGISGPSWEAACARMPADINGHHFNAPTRCVNKTTAMWGEFEVPDTTCPHWGPFKRDLCSLPGKRQFSSILYDIPTGMPWNVVCSATGATIQGQSFLHPDRCLNQLSAMWGEFDVNDTSCPANPLTTSHAVSSHCPPGLECVYSMPTYINIYWESPGQWDKDVAAAQLPETEAEINAFVSALTSSPFFRGLAQYGVSQPTFMNSVDASPDCIRQYPVPASADFAHIVGFVSCEVNSLNLPTTNNLIVNLFLPPSVNPEWVNAYVLGLHVLWAGCSTYTGYHSVAPLAVIGRNGSVAPTVPFAVIPTTTKCNRSFDELTSTIGHEMVESATDPGLFGWYDNSVNSVIAAGTPWVEIGDMCSEIFPRTTKKFSSGTVEAYWSNQPPGCVFGGLP